MKIPLQILKYKLSNLYSFSYIYCNVDYKDLVNFSSSGYLSMVIRSDYLLNTHNLSGKYLVRKILQPE